MADASVIAGWFDRGVAQGAAFMLVVCDTFSHEDFPVYVKPGGDLRATVKAKNDETKMSRVMEVYALGRDKAAQMAESRTWAAEAGDG